MKNVFRSPFLVSLIAAASIGIVTSTLQAELTTGTTLYTPEQAVTEITIHANTHTIFSCPAGQPQTFGLYGHQDVVPKGRYWLYEYKGGGHEPKKYEGRALISEAELAAHPQHAPKNTLTEFLRGKKYYAMTERDLRFRCGEGLRSRNACGDGGRNGGEQCDDGNTTNGDGCSEQCSIEDSYACIDSAVGQSMCMLLIPTLQDAAHVSSRPPQSSAANSIRSSSASSTPVSSAVSSAAAQPVCGNSTREGPEECDDGNRVDADACTNDCRLTCGNNQIQDSEECEDANRTDGDGCSSACRIENPPDLLPAVEWTTEASFPSGGKTQMGFGSVAAFGKLWVIGGIADGRSMSNQVFASSDDGSTWTVAERGLPYPLYGGTAVFWKNEIWLLGGRSNSDPNHWITQKTLRSPDGLTWRNGPDLPSSGFYYQAPVAVLNGTLFVFGSESAALTSPEGFWQPADSPYSGQGQKVTTLNGKMWALRDRYVAQSGDGLSWKIVGTLPLRVEGASLFSENGRLWVIGNVNDPNGTPKAPSCTKKILSSKDGISWRQTANVFGFVHCAIPVGHQQQIISFLGRTWAIGELFSQGATASTLLPSW